VLTEIDQLYVRNGGLTVTQFSGGVADGLCLQLTPHLNDYIQLTRREVTALARVLNTWVDGTEPKEQWEPLFDWDYIPL